MRYLCYLSSFLNSSPSPKSQRLLILVTSIHNKNQRHHVYTRNNLNINPTNNIRQNPHSPNQPVLLVLRQRPGTTQHRLRPSNLNPIIQTANIIPHYSRHDNLNLIRPFHQIRSDISNGITEVKTWEALVVYGDLETLGNAREGDVCSGGFVTGGPGECRRVVPHARGIT